MRIHLQDIPLALFLGELASKALRGFRLLALMSVISCFRHFLQTSPSPPKLTYFSINLVN